MASMAVTAKLHFALSEALPCLRERSSRSFCFSSANGIFRGISSFGVGNGLSCTRLVISGTSGPRPMGQHVYATGSGLETSISDTKKKDISLGNAKIVIESRDDEKIYVRVDLTGEETQKAFDSVLTDLARTAPPIPGFRKTKGGKTSNVPKSFLLQMLGRDRVTKFVIQEIISTTIADYVKKENLAVKSKCNTTQSAEELQSVFAPGQEFGFNATLEIEKSEESESDSPSS